MKKTKTLLRTEQQRETAKPSAHTPHRHWIKGDSNFRRFIVDAKGNILQLVSRGVSASVGKNVTDLMDKMIGRYKAY